MQLYKTCKYNFLNRLGKIAIVFQLNLSTILILMEAVFIFGLGNEIFLIESVSYFFEVIH